MESMDKELINEKFNNVEKEIGSLSNRVEKIEEICNDIHELIYEIKELRKDTNSIDSRLKDIEKEPADKWKALINTILSVVAGAVVTFILVKIGLK